MMWADAVADLEPGRSIKPFKHLVARLDRKQIDKLVEDSKQPEAEEKPKADFKVEPLADEIEFDDFARLDLRVAEIVAAESVEKSDKLLRLTISLGPLGTRNVFAGIKKHVDDVQSLIGKRVMCVANLAPRKMRFGVSEAMVCAAGSKPVKGKGEHLSLVEVPGGKPGERIS